ncbi:MAG: chemotaxis protein CheW [Desulfuromonadales bacterium]
MNSPASIKNSQEIIHTLPVLSGGEFFQKESYSAPVVSTLAAPSLIVETSVNSMRTPLEAILAGRVAAGCDDESSIAADVTTELIAESHLEFLCFRVYDEIYGINIMDIKEIIKLREVTEVPRAPFFVLGVLSLRGTIIPVIDMRIRLGLPSEKSTGKERIIVIKNNNSFSGLQVDEVIKVVQVPLSAVEAAPSILDGIDREFISGLGRCDGRLIIILNLENIADINMY